MPFVFLFAFLLVFPSVSLPANPEKEYEKIQEKIMEQKKKIRETRARETGILNELDTVARRLARTEAELGKYRKSLRRTEAEIRETRAEIAKTQRSIEQQKDWIGRKLRSMHRFGYSGDVLMLLVNSGDLSQMMRIWRYLEAVTLHEHELLSDYRRNLNTLDDQYGRLKTLETDLRISAEQVRSKENELAGEKKAKESILSSVRGQRERHQKMLGELKEASKRLRQLIEESSKTDTYSATGFPGLKGKLIWPVKGTIAIPYGQQRDPQFNTPVFRNGVHIRADSDSDARAVHQGKVIFAEWFKGFGQLVIINHGSGYHTLYGNLSQIFSNVGDIIKAGQVIGKIGTSGILNAPGLYFEVRYKGKPLDPAQWLRRLGR
jgi:septal ring factor EnvC (AmiA/AmiB activator)